MFLFSTRRIKLLLLLPSLIFFCVYVLYPVGFSLLTAFQDKPTYQPGRFIGFDNFAGMLADDHLWSALKNTFIIVVLELAMIPVLSFLLGLFINMKFRGSTIVKVLVFTPYVLSGIITTLVWFFIVDPRIGIINSLLGAFHIDTSSLLLIGGPTLTPFTVGVIETWKSLGFYSVLFMAGLKMIPAELYDAAAMDGAGAWRKFRHVTLAMISPTALFNLVLGIIGAFQVFSIAFVATQGGPAYATWFYVYYLYQQGFNFYHMGYASAMAWIFLVIVLAFTYLQVRWSRRWVYYEGERQE